MKILTIDSIPDDLRSQIKAGVTRTVCPMCRGGKSHEVSLSIREVEGGPLLKVSCWRASCGFYGFVSAPGVAVCANKIREGRPYDRDTKDLDEQLRDKLALDYGLKCDALQLRGWRQEDCETPTLVIPIRDCAGRIRGHLTRTFEDPKRVFSFKETGRPFIDYWPQLGQAKTVIVEDCLSAARLHGLGYMAIALLGTNMSTEDAREIAFFAQHPVYLALDRDAFDKSIKISKRHRHILPMRVVCLDEDIKNMQDDNEIKKLFGDSNAGRDTTGSSSMRESQSV